MTVDTLNNHLPEAQTRVALYLRVSTGRQAEHDLSIPDQRRQAIAYCEARGVNSLKISLMFSASTGSTASKGDGTTGPMGVKAVANWLNDHGYRTRQGARWGIGPLHNMITSAVYKGEYRFNRKIWKTNEDKPVAEQIMVPVEPIIDGKTFDDLQAALKARNPKATPPRTVTGPILLTGLATCVSCHGGMTLRTGKSGRYRYYACATCAQKGKSAS